MQRWLLRVLPVNLPLQLLESQETQQQQLRDVEQRCGEVAAEAQQAAAAAVQQLQVVAQQLSETRAGVAEQQQQLQAAVDLQGRTHARLMQLTQEHDQVPSDRCSSSLIPYLHHPA